MNLGQLLNGVRELEDDLCIFARPPWTSGAEAAVWPLGDDYRVPAEMAAHGLEYFLEVSVAKEVLEVLGQRRIPAEAEHGLLIFYALNDAYPEWVHASR